jgi:DNA repair exonuclease SbcCD nuclease subunit
MKLAVISDTHFGYAYNSELGEDSFDNAEEAIEKAMDADIILLAGDIFDSRLPRTAVWAKAIKILVKPLLKTSEVRLVHSTKKLKEISRRTLQAIPVVAIHGTHERTGEDEINAMKTLENAGLLVHLHCECIVFEKDGVKVAIHGMSGVSERQAREVLNGWNPTPLPDCVNILMIHQSIDPYVYSPTEPPTITTENLPRGFDIIIDGHIHAPSVEKVADTDLIITGSTIITQLEKSEAGCKKGIYYILLGSNKPEIRFLPLENSREFFFEDVKIEDNNARERIEFVLDNILKRGFFKKPIIKLKILGKATDVIDQELKELETKYEDRAILAFVRELESPEIAEKIEFLRNLRDQKLSIEEIGLHLLGKNLGELNFETAFDYKQAFDMLSEDEIDTFFDILMGKQATLQQIQKLPGQNAGGLKKWVDV